jgi:hypothetical protein
MEHDKNLKKRPQTWVKGQSGNPRGRVPGVERVRQLLDPHREDLIKKAVALALSGDTVALRICIDRIAPPPRAESAPVSIPSIALAGTMSDKARAIIDAVGASIISPDAAAVLLGAMANAVKIIEAEELANRIAALEARELI